MPQAMPVFVRVMGIRRERYVEFQYMVGDPDLCIELIMPFSAFSEFCERENAVIDDERGLLAGGHCAPSAPGLYHQPSWHRIPQGH
ncbi:MAG: phenol hydroxylase subunit [Magnetospirillum sp.]|nr:phenol hydroxylase subunit [Magnetospirillum sp.]